MPNVAPSPEQLAAVMRLLDGWVPIGHLGKLRSALGGRDTESQADPSIAIGLDANILLNLGKGRSNADLIDYLGQRHEGPLILPAQAIVEFWNNQASGIHALADSIRQKFDALSSAIEDLDPSYKDFREGSRGLMSDFNDRYGHVMETQIAANLTSLLEVLERAALVPSMPRAPMYEVAQRRKASKIPPGFHDGGHGDFFVWAEFLLGLLEARARGATFTKAVLITDDRKTDWSTKGTTHPVLCAEVEELVGCEFETWSLLALSRWVKELLDGRLDVDVAVVEPTPGESVTEPSSGDVEGDAGAPVEVR